MSKDLAIKRRDLKDNLGVPVGDEYVFDRKSYQYRWRQSATIFEIKLNGKWQEAMSIDWDFI